MKRALSQIALVLLCGASTVALAQESTASDGQEPDNRIVITADRIVIPALRGIRPERTIAQDEVDTYGASTVGEVIDDIKAQNGDEDPVFLVDGERVVGLDGIADLPTEAIEQLEILPRGTSQRIGGNPNRRVYNITLRKQLRSLATAASYRVATEGGWSEGRGETILTRIAGRDRLTFALKVRDSDMLLESDRNIVQPFDAVPPHVIGLADPQSVAAARSLRPATRVYEAAMAGSNRLAPWLSANFNLRGRWSRDDNLDGLASAILFDAAGEQFRGYGSDPLQRRSHYDSAASNLMLNADVGNWLVTLSGQYALSVRDVASQRPALRAVGAIALPADFDLARDPLDPFFATSTGKSASRGETGGLRLNAIGPVFRLPAGDARLRGAIEWRRDSQRSNSDFGSGPSGRTIDRETRGGEIGIDIPFADSANAGSWFPGDLSVSLDHARSDVEGSGELTRSAGSVLWQPSPMLSLTGSLAWASLPPPVEMLVDPLVVTPNIRLFDLPRGETAEISYVVGGDPALVPATQDVRRLSVNASPWAAISLNLFADYRGETLRNAVGIVSTSSLEFYNAFPARFVRDASGRLLEVDARPVNFARQVRDEIRYGGSILLPLGPASAAGAANSDAGSDSFVPLAPGAGARLQANVSHTIALQDRVFLSEGAAPIDLLDGGAAGVGGGRPRHLIDASMAISDRGLGARLAGQYRSGSRTIAGGPVSRDLAFGDLAVVNLRAFADLDRILPAVPISKGTRLTLSVLNLANSRQTVVDGSGVIPLVYQPAYRDPIGRSFEIELRKTF